MSRTRQLLTLSIAVVLVASAASLVAQYQVNRQLYGTPGPSASVRYAPQYLGGQPTSPSSAQLMPSELRNYYARSGSMPSDIRMGYARVGPLAPTGPVAYIPPPQNLRGSVAAMPQGNLIDSRVTGTIGSGPTSPFVAAGPGSIQYHALAAPPSYAAPRPPVGAAPAAAAPPAGVNASLTPNPYAPAGPSASIRYSWP